MIERVRIAHQKETIDIFFSYLSGNWIYSDVISEINKLGIITINISFDDKLKFWNVLTEHGFSGNADIAPLFDICITCQSSADVSKYIYVGANPLFFPPATNPNLNNFENLPKDIEVSFIGQKYGARSEIIGMLLDNGIPLTVYGEGWPSGMVTTEEMQNIFSRSLINLGFGYIGASNKVVGLKERDFEGPLSGGLYITTYNRDLKSCYKLGEEIESYKDSSELLRKVKYYLNHPEKAKSKGLRGRNRVLEDHTWEKRFGMIINLIRK